MRSKVISPGQWDVLLVGRWRERQLREQVPEVLHPRSDIFRAPDSAPSLLVHSAHSDIYRVCGHETLSGKIT